jgi:hypothetical protein
MFFSTLIQGLGSGTGQAFLKGEIWIRNKILQNTNHRPVFRIRMFLGLLDPELCVRIRILLSTSKKLVKLLNDFLSLKTDVNVSTESNKQNKFRENKTCFFVGILEVIDEKRRIRIRKLSVRIQGSGFEPNVTDPEHCHRRMGKEKNNLPEIPAPRYRFPD